MMNGYTMKNVKHSMKDNDIRKILNEYLNLSLDENGWLITDILGKPFIATNLYEFLYNSETLSYDETCRVNNVYNKWLDDNREIHVKPLINILNNYEISYIEGVREIVHRKTNKILDIKETFKNSYLYYCEPVIKQTILMWSIKQKKY